MTLNEVRQFTWRHMEPDEVSEFLRRHQAGKYMAFGIANFIDEQAKQLLELKEKISEQSELLLELKMALKYLHRHSKRLSRFDGWPGNEAIADAERAEAATALEASRAATESVRTQMLQAAAKRASKAAEVDRAAAALIDALKSFKEASAPIEKTTADLLRARTTTARFVDCASIVLPHAAGTGRLTNEAFARVVREALDVLKPPGAGTVGGGLVVVDPYANIKERTFVSANAEALAILEARTA
jgi:SAM-dependent methyltransferase